MSKILAEGSRKPVDWFTLDLPFPVSINRLWRGGKGRVYRSKAYMDWIREAGDSIVEQNPGKVSGRYSLSVDLSPPDRRKRDLDNFSSKALSDLLVAHGCIDDDHLCQAIYSRWCFDSQIRCYVTVVSAPEITRKKTGP